MALRSQACHNCGASVPARAQQCPYCDTWFDASTPGGTTARRVDPNAGEFGVQGWGWLGVALGGALVFYGAGWFLEDTRYWLADAAIGLWAAALPAWLFLTSLGWRAGRGAWLSGIAFAVALFIVHLALMGILAGRVQDDYVGIAAMFAGAALGGWLLGRILHNTLRRAWARSAGTGV